MRQSAVAMQIGRKTEQFDRIGRGEGDLPTRDGLPGRHRYSDVQVGAVMMQMSRIAGGHGLRLPTELHAARQDAHESRPSRRRTLAPNFNVQDSIRRNAASLMQGADANRACRCRGRSRRLLELRTFVQALPGRLNRVHGRGRPTNEFKLKMEVIDEGALIEGFQKVANRIALGPRPRRAHRRRGDADAGEDHIHDLRVSGPGHAALHGGSSREGSGWRSRF